MSNKGCSPWAQFMLEGDTYLYFNIEKKIEWNELNTNFWRGGGGGG